MGSVLKCMSCRKRLLSFEKKCSKLSLCYWIKPDIFVQTYNKVLLIETIPWINFSSRKRNDTFKKLNSDTCNTLESCKVQVRVPVVNFGSSYAEHTLCSEQKKNIFIFACLIWLISKFNISNVTSTRMLTLSLSLKMTTIIMPHFTVIYNYKKILSFSKHTDDSNTTSVTSFQ